MDECIYFMLTVAFPLQRCLDVCATMLHHSVLYSRIISSDRRHCHRVSPYTIQCHLEVLTHCYQKRTRNVVPSRRHSPHLCAVSLFSAAVNRKSLQSFFLHYANTIFYIGLCLGVGQIWFVATFDIHSARPESRQDIYPKPDRFSPHTLQATSPRSTLTLRRLMSYIYGAPILDVSRSHTTTQHSR